MPQVLGVDHYTDQSLEIEGFVKRDSDDLEASAEINSDVGSCDFRTNAKLSDFENALYSGFVQTVKSERLRAKAEIDLERVTRVLPHVLHIRDNARIDSGMLTVQLEPKTENDVSSWSFSLEAKELATTVDEEKHSWESPLTVSANIVQDHGQIRIDKLNCQSDFLTLSGSGSTTASEFTAHANLNLLMQENRTRRRSCRVPTCRYC